jgi:hypothetical protein
VNLVKTTYYYQVKTPVNGVYIFMLEGGFKINGEELNKRDAIGVYEPTRLVNTNQFKNLLTNH